MPSPAGGKTKDKKTRLLAAQMAAARTAAVKKKTAAAGRGGNCGKEGTGCDSGEKTGESSQELKGELHSQIEFATLRQTSRAAVWAASARA